MYYSVKSRSCFWKFRSPLDQQHCASSTSNSVGWAMGNNKCKIYSSGAETKWGRQDTLRIGWEIPALFQEEYQHISIRLQILSQNVLCSGVVASIEKVSQSKFLKNINATVYGIITGNGKVTKLGKHHLRLDRLQVDVYKTCGRMTIAKSKFSNLYSLPSESQWGFNS